VPKAN